MWAWMDEYQQMVEEAEPSPPRPLAMFGLTPGGSITFTIDDIPPWLLRRNDPDPLRFIDLTDVRTIVAKHIPEDDTAPRQGWVRRWFTGPEPREIPTDWTPPRGALDPARYEARIKGDPTPQPATPDVRDYFPETPYADSLMRDLTDAHLNAIGEARREAASEAVLVAALHLETHLENLPDQTMLDSLARAATHDCINVVRELHAKLCASESGGA